MMEDPYQESSSSSRACQEGTGYRHNTPKKEREGGRVSSHHSILRGQEVRGVSFHHTFKQGVERRKGVVVTVLLLVG